MNKPIAPGKERCYNASQRADASNVTRTGELGIAVFSPCRVTEHDSKCKVLLHQIQKWADRHIQDHVNAGY